MIGPKITTVFRSRWHALFWSASILVTAYCSVPSDDTTQSIADAVKTAKPPPHHVNPWAKDTK